MDIFEQLLEKARKNPQKIGFPESDNEMILKCAQEVVARQIGTPVFAGKKEVIAEKAKQYAVSIDGFEIIDLEDPAVIDALVADVLELGAEFSEKSIRRKAKKPLNFLMFLLKTGKIDGLAAGRVYTTADVIISASEVVGFKEGNKTISSLGILKIPNYEGSEGQLLCLADCAVNAQPDAEALADIAISSAKTVRTLLDWEPRVAMLAFSTDGSSEHDSIDVIREGIKLAKEREPELKIDGEFQLDSAIVPKVAANKIKRESEVAGKANVLIFPNLHAGNIGVKIFQIFIGADAYGPILQGFKKPICDFSRSAPLSEMIGNIIMLIIRAGEEN